ncbi:MAG TPA: hypothetical protein DIT62_04060, partial [Alphaproteobacteria bacterium]|nr:hypothetical protein [Alphaproteobacteria bacterium]
GLSLILMRIFAAAGLALATSISLWCSAMILTVILVMRRRLDSSVLWPLIKIMLAAMIMAGLVYGLKQHLPAMLAWQSLAILMLASIMIYAPLVMLTGIWRSLKA